MPGFTLDVQGLNVLFKFLEGLFEIARPVRSKSIENVSPGLTKENVSSGQVISAIRYGSSCVALFMVRPVLLLPIVYRWNRQPDRVEGRCWYFRND